MCLNDRKAKVTLFCTKFYGHGLLPLCGLHVGRVSMSPNAMCDLEVMMDSVGTMSNDVSK